MPNRLGGALKKELDAAHQSEAKNPNTEVKDPKKGKKVPFHGKDIEIRTDGAIVHTDLNGNEIEEAHHYMHAIFDIILYDARDKLDAINSALEEYAKVVSDQNPAAGEAGAYLTKVSVFNDYCASLQPGGSSPYSSAFTCVSIEPVVTNEGFIVSCRVKLNWKNPYHSSSTVKIP
jgi:hypothetical protein